MTKQKQNERQESIDRLREILKPGDTVHCVLRHVSASGMSRRIDFYKLTDGEPQFLSGYIGKAIGERHDYRKGGLVISGCGMDMGFHVVYELSRTLFPKGFIPADAGTSGRNGSPASQLDTDGGYALKSSWL